MKGNLIWISVYIEGKGVNEDKKGDKRKRKWLIVVKEEMRRCERGWEGSGECMFIYIYMNIPFKILKLYYKMYAIF
jgi:hypothetical protein